MGNMNTKKSLFDVLFEVLSSMLMNLSWKELMKYRKLSRLWRDAGTSCILAQNKPTFTLNYIVDGATQTYVRLGRSKDPSMRTLTQLNDFIEANLRDGGDGTFTSTFPCTSFLVNGPLDTEDMKRFLALHGPNIKQMSICLYSRTPETILETFAHFLRFQAPNLTRLYVRGVPLDWKDKKTPKLFPDPVKVTLPKLQFLSVHRVGIPRLEEIQVAAINLKEFEDGGAYISLTNKKPEPPKDKTTEEKPESSPAPKSD
jgi:hypothetical protein